MVSLNPYVLTTTAGEGLWGEGWEERGAGDSQGISEFTFLLCCCLVQEGTVLAPSTLA